MSNAKAWASLPQSSSRSDSVFEMVFNLAGPQLPLTGLRFLPATKFCEPVISRVTQMMASYIQRAFCRPRNETQVTGDFPVLFQPARCTGFHFWSYRARASIPASQTDGKASLSISHYRSSGSPSSSQPACCCLSLVIIQNPYSGPAVGRAFTPFAPFQVIQRQTRSTKEIVDRLYANTFHVRFYYYKILVS